MSCGVKWRKMSGFKLGSFIERIAMNAVEIASLGFGASGVGLALYQLYKRREAKGRREKLERQIDKKEEMRSLLNDIKELRSSLERLHEYFVDPLSHEDMRFSLRDISRDVLVYHHSTGEPGVIEVKEVTRGIGEQKEVLQTPNQVRETYESGNLVFTKLGLANEEEAFLGSYAYGIDHVFQPLVIAYKTLDKLNGEYADWVDEFDSGLEADVREILDSIVHHSYEQILEKENEVAFDPNDYDTTRSLTNDVYRTFVLSKQVEREIDRLEEMTERIEETQTNIAVAAN